MKRVWRHSLRRRLLGVMMVTTLAALVVALAAMIGYDLHVYRNVWVGDATAQAEMIGRAAAAIVTSDGASTPDAGLALLRFQPRTRAAAIYGPRGRLIARYFGPGPTPPLPALPGSDGAAVEGDDIVAWKRIVADGQILGTVYLRTQYPLYGRLLGYAGIAAVVGLIAMGVAWLVSYRLERVITRPILAMSAAAHEAVAARDYSRRVQRSSDDEVGALVDAFNEMMVEIEQRTHALEASNLDKAREVDERRGAQQEVMRLNEELERRVRQRTRQLETSNADLLLATESAEQANRAKSEFLSSMSHELRTPLNAIIGFGELLARADERPPAPERNKAFVGHIVQAGRHLLTLINDILNLAQIEAGKLTVSVEPVALDDLLEECRTMTEPSAQARNIRLLFPEPAGAQVLADRTRLKQVLLNLLSNAVKYNRENGSVVLDLARPQPDLMRLSVQDTGVGMRAEQVAALFQPFNRLGQEGGALEGTGIGLVVTKRLTELMGGSLGVNSTPGSGSLFWVELRAVAAALALPDVSAAVGHAANDADVSATVLCVEDNPVSLKLIQEVLAQRDGVRLLTATNGRAGVEMARRHRPDVILMDNNMPVMSGREAQAILRGDPVTATIPIIAISANAMPGAVADGLEAGFFRYLTKPIEIPGLIEAVDSALALVAERRRAG